MSKLKRGFIPIRLNEYVDKHLISNPGTDRKDLVHRLRETIAAFKADERCQCGEPIWMIGSAELGLTCFTCATGEAVPDDDYEIDVDDLGIA